MPKSMNQDINSLSINKSYYINGLDGLRAFAILSVVCYHFGFSFAFGGFLGVDVFFVISGFLITSNILMLNKESNFNLPMFWIRRIRRLLPAAYIMILTIFSWTAIFNSNLITKMKGDSVASIFYMSNWWLIFHKVSYFDSFQSPSPFKNLWSLAIEEQFYMIWPIVLITGITLFKKQKNLSIIIFMTAICSAIWMAIVYQPFEDPSRVYYGTDTRAFELLIGGCLAVIYPVNNYRIRRFAIRQRQKLNIVGTISFAILIFSVHLVKEYDPFLYRGGMFFIGLNTAVLIACISSPGNYLGHLMAWKPLSYIGKRSYGIYLWHYPIFILSTPAYEIGNANYWRVALQLMATLIIAEISYRFIEMPIRKNGFREYFRRFLIMKGIKSKCVIFARCITMVLVIGMGIISITACARSSDDSQQQKEQRRQEIASVVMSSKDTYTKKSKTSSKASYNKILAIGDSIMLDISTSLNRKYHNITIDGKVGRQLIQAVKLAPKYSKFNTKNSAVILELGTNGPFSDSKINKLLNSFSKAHVYLVNTRVPRQWEKDVNKMLRKKAKERKNVTLIDWYSVAIKHPEYFASDGVHLQPKGVKALVTLINKALK
ncbi:acyltransferase family protein [Anaeromicropila herbilytica]|uniref:Acyltransferase n=1 Tax=Anaeromicropila herbilytica TaxID=2785025 RepID=A0A7R7EI64_9FIRM|nr:acyltransferase family protein [Anaeromicropila herbilytica]BCN29218.1 acyltransferase [Anaeromicropila herbilytica]